MRLRAERGVKRREVINGDADGHQEHSCPRHADEEQSILPPGEHSSPCRNTREQAHRKRSIGHGGDADQISSANSYSSDTSNPRTGAQELPITSLQESVHSGASFSGGQSRRFEEVAVQEFLSDVCDEVVKDEEHKNQCGLLASVTKSRLSPSPVLNRIQGSRHVQRVLRCVRDRWKGPGTQWRRLRWRRRGPQQNPQLPRTSRQSLRQGRQTIQETPVPVMQPVQIMESPLGPVKTIIDKELEQSCVERSERVLADMAIANSSTAEKKVRLQVEQPRKEYKQLKKSAEPAAKDR